MYSTARNGVNSLCAGLVVTGLFGLRVRASRSVRRLRRILRRSGCWNTNLGRFGEMLVRHLQVVLRGHGLAVADLLADNMDGELLGQFRLSRSTQVVE
jgi:hypothetical protein